MFSSKKKGDIGEIIAIQYLQKNGYSIINTNFKYGRLGEVDIICKKEDIVCFIEVKYRENVKYGLPEESITKQKLHKLKKTIEFYVVRHGLDFEKIRVDAITISKLESNYRIKHYKNLEI